MSILAEAVVFLVAAVIAVTISRRLGLGAVLGYLAAGAVFGPFCLGVVANVDRVIHFAELGVVLLLFIIGLELQPARLLTMRKSVFGLGGAQVIATAAIEGSWRHRPAPRDVSRQHRSGLRTSQGTRLAGLRSR
ncbi:MAG: cation:proton antiporter [Rhodospirillales bacterium]|nr:cation:proton antiporter [Rhodospirillales bacterium]